MLKRSCHIQWHIDQQTGPEFSAWALDASTQIVTQPQRVNAESGFVGAMPMKPSEVAELQISKPKMRASWCLSVEHKINTGFILGVHHGFAGSESNHLEMCGYQIGLRIPV